MQFIQVLHTCSAPFYKGSHWIILEEKQQT